MGQTLVRNHEETIYGRRKTRITTPALSAYFCSGDMGKSTKRGLRLMHQDTNVKLYIILSLLRHTCIASCERVGLQG